MKQRPISASQKNLWRWARTRAKRYGVPFDIEPADICIPDKCPVFGVKLKVGHKSFAPSLDRIVPEWGYTKGNVLVVSRRANQLKSDACPWELRQVADFFEQHILDSLKQ